MSNKRLWLIRVIVIVGVTAVVAVVKQFNLMLAAVIGGITVGGAIAYLITIKGARWQKPLWWIAVLYLFFLAITIGSIGFWTQAVFMASLAVGIVAAHVVMAMQHKKIGGCFQGKRC